MLEQDLSQGGPGEGGLMMTEYFSYPEAFRAGAVLQDLARRQEELRVSRKVNSSIRSPLR